ncbi:hypothetical protein GCM10009799_47690 [Nocardiopsis rhodophaea]|uniref:Uncharacterized protein n=2 Tax=Nocardiopsis rhodophaea TaxID=280238 RepID=A0ABN2TLU3_9ACTN
MLNQPSYAQQAERLRREKESEPTPAELVPELERLAGKYRNEASGPSLL